MTECIVVKGTKRISSSSALRAARCWGINLILSHDPEKLKNDIEKSKEHIFEVRKKINSSEMLRPLDKQLSSIEAHFNSIGRVADIYDDVYKNILKPVQEEGCSGVRATARWAIFSIILSWGLANYSAISEFFKDLIK